MLGDTELQKPEYDTQPGRWKDRDFIVGRVREILKTETAEHWMEMLRAARIPHAPVNDFAHALHDPQIRSRDMVVTVEHPEGGSVEMPGNPAKLSDHEDSYGPPPLLGQHTDEVLRNLVGLSDGEIEKLRQDCAIQ